jgi:outer membrane protein TolC
VRVGRGVILSCKAQRRQGTWAVRLAWLAIVLASSRSTHAEDAATLDTRPGAIIVDLTTAVRLARTRSPSLAPSRAALSATSAIADAAEVSLPTPPRVEFQAGPRIQHGALPVGAEVTIAAWQDISLGGFGAARRELSTSLAREAGAGVTVAEWDAAARAAFAWTDARLAAELERIRNEALKYAEELRRVAELRVQSGRSDAGEEALARAVVGSARAAVLDAEGRRFSAESELRFSTGLSATTRLEVSGEFDASDELLDIDALLAQARTAQPDMALARASADRRSRSADLSLAAGKPILALGPLVTHEGTGDWIVEARVSLPLPFFNPAAFDSAHARSDALVAQASAQEQRLRLETEIRIAFHEREHARAVRDALRDGALSPARAALDIASKQYAAGSAELPIVLSARRELLDAEQRLVEAVADVRRTDVRLARLLGRDPSVSLTTQGKR